MCRNNSIVQSEGKGKTTRNKLKEIFEKQTNFVYVFCCVIVTVLCACSIRHNQTTEQHGGLWRSRNDFGKFSGNLKTL